MPISALYFRTVACRRCNQVLQKTAVLPPLGGMLPDVDCRYLSRHLTEDESAVKVSRNQDVFPGRTAYLVGTSNDADLSLSFGDRVRSLKLERKVRWRTHLFQSRGLRERELRVTTG